LFDGGTVFFRPPLFSSDEFADALLSTRATNVCAVPTMLRELLIEHQRRAAPLFPDLRILVCFGAPLAAEEKLLARRVLSQRFIEMYNSSVSGRVSSLFGGDMDARPETVGRVHPHVALQIVDDNDKPLPNGTPGTIRVRSCTMARATFGKTPRTSGDRLKDGWAYPGDIGSVDRDGFLTLHGRESDVIVRAGVNVHPSEVEAALSGIAGVREAAVVGFASTREGEEIAAFVVTDGTLSEEMLDAQLRTRLAADRRPRKFILVEQLPRNANGKVVRAELRAKLEQA
jgi:acyl-CoA synthetase (AMP-forming)/AMP-acid ligase II